MADAANVQQMLASAKKKCAESGVKLTEKRQKILELMLLSDIPLSPYEVVDRYNEQMPSSMPANSAYRILDFLVSENLAHKLSSANKYIACSHIACSHHHEVPQFLICRACKRVKEIMINRTLIKELGENIEQAGYKMLSSAIELDCLCGECAD